MNNNGPLDWYFDIPIVSRVYLTMCLLTTSLCALEIVSPLSLYYNFDLITQKFQLWRVFTTFLFFGNFSIDFVFHMYFSIRYCRLLEENSFRGRTDDFLFLIAYGVLSILLIAPFNFVNLPFLGSALTFMLVYLWGRRNPQVQLSFLGLFPFTANYLAYVLLIFSIVFGNNIVVDLIGIAVGHIYFFFDDIYPEIARIRKWKVRHFLRAPVWMKLILQNNVFLVPPPAPAPPQPDIPRHDFEALFNDMFEQPEAVVLNHAPETQTQPVLEQRTLESKAEEENLRKELERFQKPTGVNIGENVSIGKNVLLGKSSEGLNSVESDSSVLLAQPVPSINLRELHEERLRRRQVKKE